MLTADTKDDNRPNSYVGQKAQQPVTLIWKDIVYSVTYKRKQIKEAHLRNQQHDDPTVEDENLRQDRSISNSSQVERDDILEIKDKVDPLVPLIGKT